MTSFPHVTIIVPVRNARTGLQRLLTRLAEQTYPQDRYDIIVVANCTQDTYDDLVQSYPNVKLLRENTKPNAYTARNLGLASVRGTVIAFTDADCEPEPGWLAAGVQCMEREDAALVAGAIRFDVRDGAGAAEVLDSFMYLQQERNVSQRQMAATANLFVAKTVFDRLGPFADACVSAGDTILCQQAVQAGFRLVFCSEAIVHHPARSAGPLLRKAYETGQGIAERRRVLRGRLTGPQRDHPLLELLNPFTLRRRLKTQGRHVVWSQWCAMVALAYLATLTGIVGYGVWSLRGVDSK